MQNLNDEVYGLTPVRCRKANVKGLFISFLYNPR